MKSASASAIDLKKQQFQSTKERPELNPVLSALINEDIKKSIDAKRHAEFNSYDSSPLSEASKLVVPTTAAPVQTTVKYIPKAHDDSVVVDSIAGSSSEKKQVFRMKIQQIQQFNIHEMSGNSCNFPFFLLLQYTTETNNRNARNQRENSFKKNCVQTEAKVGTRLANSRTPYTQNHTLYLFMLFLDITN